jgi:hypothetical protein
MLQVYLLPSLAVELHFRKCTGVFGEIVELRAGWLFYQLKDLLIAFPGSDIRLGVSDIQDHLRMVVVQAVVPLFHNHLVAVRGAILAEPSGVIKVVRVEGKRISLPMAKPRIRTNVSLTLFAQDRQSAQNG